MLGIASQSRADDEEKVVLITGASSGMGKSTALQLTKEGYIVYGAARRVKEMDDLVKAGGHALFLDLTDESSIRKAVSEVIKEQGRIDVLINNAGHGLLVTIEDADMEYAKHLFQVNLFALAYITRQVLPYMRQNKFGRITNISSGGGKCHTPFGGWYHATKFALEGLSDVLRMEVKPFGIDVIIIEPGLIKTELGNVLAKQLDNTPPNTAYGKRYQKIGQFIKKNIDVGSHPSVIAETILKSMRAKRPKTRYPAGWGAHPFLFLRKILSDRMIDQILNRMFSLNEVVEK